MRLLSLPGTSVDLLKKMFFIIVFKIKPRASSMPGKCYTIWVTPSALLLCILFLR
jgi:hypothetical protein